VRNALLLAGIVAGAALPVMASAQPYDRGCVEANRSNRVAGTVIGGIAGAVIGSAVAGRGSRGAGAVIGGATGAVAGNAIAGSNNQPCPPGYAWQGPPPEPAAYGFWRDAPTGIHARIDFMQQRLDTASARGWISRGDYRDLSAELNSVRREHDQLRDRDGGRLYPQDRAYLQSQLDDMSAHLHWAARG
jgi:hypothetical protein